MCKNKEMEIDPNKQELLKEVLGSPRVSPERIENLIQQIKRGIKNN